MFESCMTYEAGLIEAVDFPPTDSPVWILGKQYSAKYDLDELRADVKSKIWLTYRKNFPPIGGNGPTSDSGWGCMLRCGQMVLAQALIWRHLGRDWMWQPHCHDPVYTRILRMFGDKKNALYSIHQIAQMGESEGKAVGQWFGPNTVAQVLRKLSVYDDWNKIVVHVAMDNTIVVDEIKMECKCVDSCAPKKESDTSLFTDENKRLSSSHKKNGYLGQGPSDHGTGKKTVGGWKPLLLFIPLRLGLSDINPVYIRGLKKCFTFKQSLGLIGGRPNHACYFIGFVGKELVYLDPHTSQSAVCLDCADPKCTKSSDESYHCSSASRMDFLMLDPSIALIFYCPTEEEFDQLCEQIQRVIVQQESTPLFEICKERRWFGAEGGTYKLTDFNSEFHVVDTERTFDTSDDEYELL